MCSTMPSYKFFSQLTFSLWVLLLTGCTERSENHSPRKNIGFEAKEATQYTKTDGDTDKLLNELMIDTLVPLTMLDKKKSSDFEKYGIGFAGSCYDCDLATCVLQTDQIVFINICDDKIADSATTKNGSEND